MTEPRSAPRSQPVVLAPHDPAWAAAAEREGARLARALGDLIVRVHHVGSTAIPGICAKPILDLIPVVRSLASLEKARATLKALGYAWWGEYVLSGRRFFTLSDDRGLRVVHAHAYEEGSEEITRHLAVRDHVRAHPEIARAYDAAKARARALHPDDSLAYSREKHAFLQQLQAEALALVAHPGGSKRIV